MSSFDELLVHSGAMTEAQLAIAREEQELRGGSLDASILGLGYLTEPALQRIMRQLWRHDDDTDYLAQPSKEALALLRAEDAQRIGAVPQSVAGRQLTVLVNEQAALQSLGELDALADYDLRAVALNEVRLGHLLHEHYGVPQEPRYREIMERVLARTQERGRSRRSAQDSLIGDPMAGLEPGYLAGAEVIRPSDAGASAAAARGAGVGAGVDRAGANGAPSGALAGAAMGDDLDADVIPLLEDELLIEVVEEDEEGTTAEEADQTGEQTLQEAHQRLAADDFASALDAVTTMEGLPDVFFRFGVPYFKSVALFKVQGGMVMGWRGAGLGILSELIRGIVVPVQSDTFLARGIEEGPYAGPANANPVEERIAEQLGASGEARVVTAAVKLGERPVLVVCGLTDGGAEGEGGAAAAAPDAHVVTQLGQLCEQASQTVLRLIMERKQAKEQGPAAKPPATDEQPTAAKQDEQDERGERGERDESARAGGAAAPAAETPAAETPAAETPAAETPAAETAAKEADTEGAGAADADTADADTSDDDDGDADAADADTSDDDDGDADAADADTSDDDDGDADAADADTSDDDDGDADASDEDADDEPGEHPLKKSPSKKKKGSKKKSRKK